MYAVEWTQADISTLQLLIDNGADVNAVSIGLEFTPLDLAACAGRPEIVHYLLDAGANPRCVSHSGSTAISYCSSEADVGHLAILELLLEAGTDPNVVGSHGECALFSAVRFGNFRAVRLLLDHVARRELVELSPFSWAVVLGTVDEVAAEVRSYGELAARECAERGPWLMTLLSGDVAKAGLLQANGANLHTRGSRNRTNLMFSVSCDHVEMTRWLLAQGADLHAQDEFGQTALMEAIAYKAARCVRVLLEAGAPLRNPDGYQAVARATDADVVRVLVEAGADIDAREDEDGVILGGWWPLLTAADLGDNQFVRLCLALGADPNRQFTGETALHRAAGNDHLEIVQLLLQRGADPNASDCDMHTPLMNAQSLECVDLLLNAGADINAFDCTGATVVQHHHDPEILDRLTAAGAAFDSPPESLNSLILSAARDGDLELLDYLLRNEVDVNAPTHLRMTPLMAAAERGHAEVLRRLIAAGADLHAREYQGRTALFYAAAPESGIPFQLTRQFDPDSLRSLLCEQFATMSDKVREMMENMPMTTPDYGYHPSDDVEAIDLLVQAGALVDARDAEGATPLLVACGCGRSARVARLLQLGADIDARDAAERSTRDMAAGHHDAVQSAAILRLLDATKEILPT